MQLSVIIPTLNEADNIDELLTSLSGVTLGENVEIIVVDGQSDDATLLNCSKFDHVKVISTDRGRAHQMNRGADCAKGEVFYFLHADTRPPDSFCDDITRAFEEGFEMGSYRFRFDSPKGLLKINNFFTRFNKMWARGGDQSLFITRAAFEALHGYREEYVIMEEYDLLRRAKESGFRFKLIPKEILVSARKYEANHYLKVQIANLVVFNMFRFGYEPQRILNMYRRLIDYRS